MTDTFNPYTTPTAELEPHAQVGAVVRDGKFVRMDRNGQLPPRCVNCNAPALPVRIGRTLYWTTWQWKLFAWGVPSVLLALSFVGISSAMIMFWPVVLIIAIANVAIRKRVNMDFGICARHRKLRRILFGCAVALLLVVIFALVGTMVTGDTVFGPWIVLLVPLMLLLGLANSFSPVNSVRLAKVTTAHLWLKSANKEFLNSLPEAAAEGAVNSRNAA